LPRREVPAGEFLLDRLLPVLQPVHRGVGFVGGRVFDAEVGAEGRVRPPGDRGQLRAGVHDAGDDQGQGNVALPPGGTEQRGQAELRGHRVNRGDVPVRQRPRDGDRGLPGGDEDLALQRGLDRVHHGRRHLRQARQGLVPDLAAVAVGVTQQS
jgi:hypothetical protein